MQEVAGSSRFLRPRARPSHPMPVTFCDMSKEGEGEKHVNTITVKDGTTIGGPVSRLFSPMVGRSQLTIGTRKCCSS